MDRRFPPRLGVLIQALMLAALAACERPAGPSFTEVGVAAGLTQVLLCGADLSVKQTILEVNGNGLALLDVDSDGDLDVVLVQGSTSERWIEGASATHHLLLNRSERGLVPGPDGRSVPPLEEVFDHGLVMSGWPTGVASADVDGDGRPDLIVGGLGEDALFLNRTEHGRASFEKHVLPGRNSALDWTTSVALADADGDGLLDLYLGRYLTVDPRDPPMDSIGGLPCRWLGHAVMCGPHGLPAQPDVLLRGLGAAPWFADATEASGVAAAPPAYALGVLFADLDADGRPDLYVANDSTDNFVLANRGGLHFDHVGRLSGAATDMGGRPQAGMGVALGDVDGDGDFDLAVTNFSDESNALYRNEGALLFRETSAAAGIAAGSRALLGWGLELADFDGDGLLDMFVANGHVYPEADQPDTGSSYAQPTLLLPGLGDGRFGLDLLNSDQRFVCRGSARGDLDGDGDLDVLVLQLNGRPLLLLNNTDAPERQLLVTLEDRVDPLGAVLEVHTAAGLRSAVKLSSTSFQCAGDPRLHIGGGGRVLAARVLWPGGQSEELDAGHVAFGRHIRVRRGAGVVASSPLRGVR